ncbi:MAG: penicillin-binding transpeptidase domain-containing protein, partial [Alphaproteobacteria bacterium]
AEAIAQPLNAGTGEAVRLVNARYFTSAIAQDLIGLYGEDSLFEGGLSIRTTVEPDLQRAAHKVLRDGLVSFDRRQGWRGPVDHIDPAQFTTEEGQDDARAQLIDLDADLDFKPWYHALVTSVTDDAALILLATGQGGKLPLSGMEWARAAAKSEKGSKGPTPKKPSDVVKVGDIVLVEPQGDGKSYVLRQEPEVNGGLVAMDPHTGRVLALVGGFSYARSRFNRAIQAERQPGSAFKPFVYAAGLDVGFTPSSLVLDAPFVMDQGPGKPMWKPANYSNKFYGPSTLRLGIEKSRNLMTVRLAQYIGMESVIAYAKHFGIGKGMQKVLASSLGSHEVTLIDMTNAYAMLVNGGKRIHPVLIDRVQDRWGGTVFKSDDRACTSCQADEWMGNPPPRLPDERERVISSGTAYQMVSMLEGVVQRGTGVRVKTVGKPLAGKTGTTNESRDAWFVGFSPDLAVGVYVGYDNPRSLGRRETGSSAAAPIFRDFMKAALKGKPATPFRIPPDIRLVRVNVKTGKGALPGDRNVILEAFKPGTGPDTEASVVDGTYRGGSSGSSGNSGLSGTGGLY